MNRKEADHNNSFFQLMYEYFCSFWSQ